MSTTNKKAYVYKMNLIPANILGLVIFFLLVIVTIMFGVSIYSDINIFLFLGVMILYLMLHELLHGIGYLIGGTKRENIQYGICLEKGLMYAMTYQEVNKRNILISLQMPFMVIGVITYIIGIIFNIPILVLLSIVNLVGASMDLVMFFYILSLPRNITYSESGKCDEFVIISDEDLTKRKNLFFRIVEVRDYNKNDYIFKNIKRVVSTKTSNIILGVIFIASILSVVL